MMCHTENLIKKTTKLQSQTSEYGNFQVLFVLTNQFYTEFKNEKWTYCFRKEFGRIIINDKAR